MHAYQNSGSMLGTLHYLLLIPSLLFADMFCCLTCHIKWGTIKYKFKITFKFVELALFRLDVVIDEDLLQIKTWKLSCLFLTKLNKSLRNHYFNKEPKCNT